MKEIELSKNQEDRIVNRITGRGCPKCGWEIRHRYGEHHQEIDQSNYKTLDWICSSCNYVYSLPNPNYGIKPTFFCGGGSHSTIEEATRCGNHNYKCEKCGYLWCDHTNVIK